MKLAKYERGGQIRKKFLNVVRRLFFILGTTGSYGRVLNRGLT